MAVVLQAKHYWYMIGHGEFFYSFFSTVYYRLEGQKWGSRFPTIMNEMYQGCVEVSEIDQALEEMECIRSELQYFEPDQVIWSAEDLSLTPPWGDVISEDITSLANYFVTSHGENLLNVICDALQDAKNLKCKLEVRSV